MREGGGRVAVVSGANRGLGLEIVRHLAAAGLRVVLGSRSADNGHTARAGLGAVADRVAVRELDVTDPVSVAGLTRWLRDRFGRCDVLVNNAGVSIDDWQDAASLDLAVARRTMETNLFGAWQLTQAIVPAMRARRYGRVVNVSSRLGQLSTMAGDLGSYRVSKSALNALTRVLAAELRGDGILVNTYCPGWVGTAMGGAGARVAAADAADTAIWLATLPDGGPTGGFFRERQPIDW